MRFSQAGGEITSFVQPRLATYLSDHGEPQRTPAMNDTIRSRLRPKRPPARSTSMATTCTHQTFTVPRLPERSALPSAHGLGNAMTKRVGAFLARLLTP